MSIALYIKNNLKNIPPSIGQFINKLSYKKRPGLGDIYSQRRFEIDLMSKANIEEQQIFVYKKVKRIVDFAYKNIKFYREYYDDNEFNPGKLNCFEDITKIPIITKAILNKYGLEDRSFTKKNRYIVNTGGSSGTPFGFYIEPSSMGHEWAHMHFIWEKLKYKSSDLKIVFGGRSDIKDIVEYDVVRNHFAIDIYADYGLLAPKLKEIIKKYKIKYLHGYPSSIYDFAIYCNEYDNELRDLMKVNLKGAFLGSEYPHKLYRETIEEVFEIKTISWYGHTERTVLAYEQNDYYNYVPFITYGFSEAILNDNNEYELISTSYYNEVSPLIRYNTQDVIEKPIINNGILNSFEILKGRNGEFVIDRYGKKVNLTGLIFGRHHEIFNYVIFLQVKQVKDGVIEIHFVSKTLSAKDANKYFDMKNLNFELTFIKRDSPHRTKAGKVNLLIND